MASGSKKRRRREREKRTQDLIQRARSISLVDAASPEPISNSSLNHAEVGPGSDIRSNGLPRDDHVTNESAVDNPVPSATDIPKEPSWKRVDFVLPRANGRKRFVFDQRKKTAEHEIIPASQVNKESNGQKAINHTSETIEDIFGNKRSSSSKKRNAHGDDDISPDKETDSKKKPRLEEKSDHGVSEVRRKKLEDAFEAVKDDTKNLPIENFVDMHQSTDRKDEGTPSSGKKKQSPNESSSAKLSKTKDTGNGAIGGSGEKQQEKAKPKSANVVQPAASGQITGRTVKEAVRDKRGLRPRANSTDGELNLPQGGLCDERMILEAHKWNAGRQFANQTSPRGFHNLGNTCFLNATLQCLTYLPPLCQTLIAISENKSRTAQNGGKKKMPQGQKITSSLCALFQQAHGLSNNSSKAGGAFAPKKVVGHLPNIGSCGSRNGYKFRLGRQEDAHEFLVHLLDAMNDGELRAAGINQNISGWRDRLPVSRLDETTFVHRIFGGYFRSQVRCRRCNYRSNTYDPFLDLSLEVSKKSSTSVLNALSEFTRKETLDAANQWKCSGCKKYVCATKQLTVFRPPLTLCIQLKRFAFDNFGFGQKFSKHNHGYGYGGGGHGGGSKITKPIEFPGTLNLPLSDNRSCQYTLTGIVIHVGGSSQSGHYTAYVKKPGKNGTSQWFHMDDSEVQPVSERTVLKQRDAYLLFYCRTEVKLEFPDPPARSMTASEATEFGRNRARARANNLSVETPTEEPKESKGDKKGTKTERIGGSDKKMSGHGIDEGNGTREEEKQNLKTTEKVSPTSDAVRSTHALLQNASGSAERLARIGKSQDVSSPSKMSNSKIHPPPENQDNSDSSSADSSYVASPSDSDDSSDTESAKVDASDISADSSSPSKSALGSVSRAMKDVNTSVTKQKTDEKKMEFETDSEDETSATQRVNASKKVSNSELDRKDESLCGKDMNISDKQFSNDCGPKESTRKDSSDSEISSQDESDKVNGQYTQLNEHTRSERSATQNHSSGSDSDSDSDSESSLNDKKQPIPKNADYSSVSAVPKNRESSSNEKKISLKKADESSDSESSMDSESSANGKKKLPQKAAESSDSESSMDSESSANGKKKISEKAEESSDSESPIDSESSANGKRKVPQKADDSSDSESSTDSESAANGKKKVPQKADESSDSESSTDSGSSANGKKKVHDDREIDAEAKAMQQCATPKTSNKTKVVENNTDSRGKVKVMLGPRKRKIWESKASALPSKGSNFQLLGNMKVSQWGDDDEEETETNGNKSTSKTSVEESKVHSKRKTIVAKIDKQIRDRKRKMHLDRWDSHLDQGKQKKVKSAASSNPHQTSSAAPKKNVFQRIQSSVQRMSRGKPKGNPLFRRKLGKKKGKF